MAFQFSYVKLLNEYIIALCTEIWKFWVHVTFNDNLVVSLFYLWFSGNYPGERNISRIGKTRKRRRIINIASKRQVLLVLDLDRFGRPVLGVKIQQNVLYFTAHFINIWWSFHEWFHIVTISPQNFLKRIIIKSVSYCWQFLLKIQSFRGRARKI